MSIFRSADGDAEFSSRFEAALTTARAHAQRRRKFTVRA